MPHERPFSQSVLKPSLLGGSHQPSCSTPAIPLALALSRYGDSCAMGARGESTGDRQGEIRGEEIGRRVSREKVLVLHSSKPPPACQWGDSPAVAAVVEQSSRRGRSWNCTTAVLDSHKEWNSSPFCKDTSIIFTKKQLYKIEFLLF